MYARIIDRTKGGVVLRISNSTVRNWRRCRRAYHYQLVRNIEPRLHRIPLYRGKLLHKMLELHQLGEDWTVVLTEAQEQLDKMFIEEIEDVEEYKNLVEDLESIMKSYLRQWKGDQLTYPHTELQLESVLIPGKVVFTGKIDCIAHFAGDDTYWLMDHKTHKKFPSEESRSISTQVMYYKWLLEQNGFPSIEGVIWDYLRTKTAQPPRILKNGLPSLSMRTLASTSYFEFKKWWNANKDSLSPENRRKYRNILLDLKEETDRYFRRVFVPVDTPSMESCIEDLRETALEMYYLHEKSQARNLSEINCRGCGYKNLCFAEMAGSDTDFILRKEYKPRDKDLSIDPAAAAQEIIVDFEEEEEEEEEEI